MADPNREGKKERGVGRRRREGGRGEREKWTSEAEMHMIKKLVYDRNGI